MRSLIILLSFLSGSTLKATSYSDSLSHRKGKIPYVIVAGYRCPITGNNIINSGQGTYIELGLNLGKYISKGLIVAPFVGWGHMGRLWNTSVDREFSNDYHGEISGLETNAMTNNIANLSADHFKNKTGSSVPMPGCAQNSFHNYALYAGVLIGLSNAIIPSIKLYTGSDRMHYQGEGGELQYKNSMTTLQLRRNMYGCEISKTNFLKSKYSLLRHLTVGIYYEYYSFTNSKLYFDNGNISESILIKDLTSASFRKKYQHSQICGAKLSFTIL